MPYRHLNYLTIPFMEMLLKEKIKWVRQKHFVFYNKARKCLEQLDWIYEQTIYEEDDFPSDLEGLTIIGNTGAGKTTIEKEFIRLHSGEHHASYEAYPVAYCMLKDSITGLKGLYSSILSAFGHPFADPDSFKYKKVTIDQLEEVLIHTLKRTRTRLLFIDEFQHTRGRNQQAILNQLKRTMLVSRVPFIPVGTPDVVKVLQLDSQLADRCPIKDYSILTYWEYNNEFRKFLSGYEQYLPFPEPSKMSGKVLSKMIFDKVKFKKVKVEKTKENVTIENVEGIGMTNLRHLVRFLKKVAIKALIKGKDRISEEDIRDTVY